MNANDPNRKSWIEYNSNTDFPIQNIPFGIGKFEDGYRVCSRIGDDVIDLVALYELGLFSNISIQKSQLQNQYLNDFIFNIIARRGMLRVDGYGFFE